MGSVDLGRDQRLVDQLRQVLDNGNRINRNIGRDGSNGREVGAAVEHRHVLEHQALRLRQRAIAPIQRGLHRLLPRLCRASPGCRQAKSAFEQMCQLLKAEGGKTACGKLDRKRDPLEP